MKNLFKKAEQTNPKTPKTSVSTDFIVVDDPLANEKLVELVEINRQMAELKARQEDAHNFIKECGIEKYAEIYEQNRRCPGSSIDLKFTGSQDAQLKFIASDRYIKIDEERANELAKNYGPDIVTSTITYAFNGSILEKHFDTLGEYLMDAPIPQEDKDLLIEAVTAHTITKGTIKNLRNFDAPIQVLLDEIKPVFQVKSPKLSK